MEILTTLVFFTAIAFYFLPAIIAFSTGKRNALAICAMNILLGWTILGWVISLIWSLIKDRA